MNERTRASAIAMWTFLIPIGMLVLYLLSVPLVVKAANEGRSQAEQMNPPKWLTNYVHPYFWLMRQHAALQVPLGGYYLWISPYYVYDPVAR